MRFVLVLAPTLYPTAIWSAALKEESRDPVRREVGGVLDRELLDNVLGVDERSGVFESNAAIVRDHYGGHGVSFFYVRTEEEVGAGGSAGLGCG